MTDVRQTRLLNVREVARVLSISRTSVYDLLAKGQIESVRIGRSRRVLADDLERFIRSLKIDQSESEGEEVNS